MTLETILNGSVTLPDINPSVFSHISLIVKEILNNYIRITAFLGKSLI